MTDDFTAGAAGTDEDLDLADRHALRRVAGLSTELSDTILFAILFIVLLVRPTGFFPGIHVEQFILAITGVLFEFHFDNTVEIDSPQEPLGEFLNGRQIDGFHIRGGASEFVGVLPLTPGQ